MKLQNILLSADGKVKVTDFGVSKVGDMFQTQVGTPYYIAPEIWKSHKYEGSKSDLWSAGIILFYITTGHLPFSGVN